MRVRLDQFPSIRLHVSSLFDYKRRKAATKEPETVAWLRRCNELYGATRLLDVGANVGGYSLINCALRPDNTALAVEPFPPTFLTLCRNIAENGLQDRITPLNGLIGSGGADPTIPLRFDVWTSGIAEHASSGRFGLRIPAYGAAELARHFRADDRVIVKIDVDGAEVGVVQALASLLRSPAARSLLIECEADTRAPIEAFLAEAAYEVSSTHGKGNQRQINLIAYRRTDP